MRPTYLVPCDKLFQRPSQGGALAVYIPKLKPWMEGVWEVGQFFEYLPGDPAAD